MQVGVAGDIKYSHHSKSNIFVMLSTLSPFLMQLSRSLNGVEAAVADNCRFDERADLQLL